ncbi:MAG TPA: GFA family protein [Chloroflexota bacterium]|nr:GFA family protein [Chloroflexota bacterium]
MNAAAEREGRCLCGAVRYAVKGDPIWVAHCHCESCRRANSAAFATFAGFRRENFRLLAGEPGRYASSPGVWRSFCARCGSPLTYEGERWPDEVHIHLPSLEDPQSLKPKAHVHVAEQLAWVHLADGLPRYATSPSSSKEN